MRDSRPAGVNECLGLISPAVTSSITKKKLADLTGKERRILRAFFKWLELRLACPECLNNKKKKCKKIGRIIKIWPKDGNYPPCYYLYKSLKPQETVQLFTEFAGSQLRLSPGRLILYKISRAIGRALGKLKQRKGKGNGR